MDAEKIIKELGRMCCSMENCADCKVSKLRDEEPHFCMHYIYKYPAEAVRIVEEWSKANPAQTNNNKFKEVFGIDFRELMFDTSANRTLWLDKPYELPKADSEKIVKEIKISFAQTRREKFKEVFGVEPHNCNGMILGAPHEKTVCILCENCNFEAGGICDMDAHAWWDAPYEAPKRRLDIDEYKF